MTRETNMTLIRDALADIDGALKLLLVKSDDKWALDYRVRGDLAIKRLHSARSFLRTVSI